MKRPAIKPTAIALFEAWNRRAKNNNSTKANFRKRTRTIPHIFLLFLLFPLSPLAGYVSRKNHTAPTPVRIATAQLGYVTARQETEFAYETRYVRPLSQRRKNEHSPRCYGIDMQVMWQIISPVFHNNPT